MAALLMLLCFYSTSAAAKDCPKGRLGQGGYHEATGQCYSDESERKYLVAKARVIQQSRARAAQTPPKQQVAPAPKPKPQAAPTPPSATESAVVTSVKASSTLPPSKAGNYNADNVLKSDGQPWVEGSPGGGAGEWLDFTFDTEREVHSIQICNGYHKSEKTFKNNARAKSATLTFSDGSSHTLSLPDDMRCRIYDLPRPKGSKARLTITDTYKGAQWQDMAISEVLFWTTPIEGSTFTADASVKADGYEEPDSAEQVFIGRIDVVASDHIDLVIPNARGEFDILRIFEKKDIEKVLSVCPNGTKVCKITGVLWEADGEIKDISSVENP